MRQMQSDVVMVLREQKISIKIDYLLVFVEIEWFLRALYLIGLSMICCQCVVRVSFT